MAICSSSSARPPATPETADDLAVALDRDRSVGGHDRPVPETRDRGEEHRLVLGPALEHARRALHHRRGVGLGDRDHRRDRAGAVLALHQ